MEENFDNLAEIEPEFARHSTREECEKQRRMLSSNSDEKLEIGNVMEDNANLDVFLFKGEIMRGVYQLIDIHNPINRTRYRKKHCEHGFKRLDEK